MNLKKASSSPIFYIVALILFFAAVLPTKAQELYEFGSDFVPPNGELIIYVNSDAWLTCYLANTNIFVGTGNASSPIYYTLPNGYEPGDYVEFACQAYDTDKDYSWRGYITISNPPSQMIQVQQACSNGATPDGIGNTCNNDEDGDGWWDWDDKCPYDYGSDSGCPVVEGTCPNGASPDEIGDPCNNNEDNDNWWDWDDACPYDYGTSNGCPSDPVAQTCPDGRAEDSIGDACDRDEDDDSFLDTNDRCPYDYGTERGCPVEGTPDLLITPKETSVINGNLNFHLEVSNLGSEEVEFAEIVADDRSLNWQQSRRSFRNLAVGETRSFSFILRLDEKALEQAGDYSFSVNIIAGGEDSNTANNHLTVSYGSEGIFRNWWDTNFTELFAYWPWFGGCLSIWFFFSFIPKLFYKPDPIPTTPWRGNSPLGKPKPPVIPPYNPPPFSPAEKKMYQKQARRRINEAQACSNGWQCKIEDPELSLQLYKVEKLSLKLREQGRQRNLKEYQFPKKICNALNDAYHHYFVLQDVDDLHASLAPVSEEMYQQINEWLKEQSLVSNLEISAELKGSGASVKFQVYRCNGGRWEKFGKPWEAQVEDEKDMEIVSFSGFHIQTARPPQDIYELNAGLDQFVQEL